ncbi:MAG: GxxExxY protein [Bacteroidota bacterium]
MSENEISYKIRGAIFEIYNSVGPGLLESAYEAALYYELSSAGLKVQKQVVLPFQYKDVYLDAAYRIDLLVEDKVIIEVKSVSELASVHYKQLTTYLKLTELKLGVLVNFNAANISEGIKRVVYRLE